ncbi:MFS transporter [Aspergillus mulundensis]|uniref:Major facilitator superfamily (MFS) profile domain-containing protein n=1 Tax=Aspergillus mulundensis TaxID=1810919 RepID=A0A3D8QJ48_9EURO|nr:Uncharacterized protein DSM5745_10413 [Aspergillus mulundensis]RDW61741.1 Uncharacterized protein DSM5745_10413 [Aspergillus mulundensis]
MTCVYKASPLMTGSRLPSPAVPLGAAPHRPFPSVYLTIDVISSCASHPIPPMDSSSEFTFMDSLSVNQAQALPPSYPASSVKPHCDIDSPIEYLDPRSHPHIEIRMHSPPFLDDTEKTQHTEAPLPVHPDIPMRIPDLPTKWSSSRKSLTTVIACGVTVMAAYAAGECSPAFDQLHRDWGVARVPYNLGTTLFTLGFAVTPMLLAPFSEAWGRRPVFLGSGVLFTVCLAGCGASNSLPGLLVGRFFLGVAGSSFSSIVGGVISDIYADHERNVPMALFSGTTLFGTGLGPLVSSIIASRTTWRWIYYSQAIVSACFVVLLYFFFDETRESVLLGRWADRMNEYFEEMEQKGCRGVYTGSGHGPRNNGPVRVRYRIESDLSKSVSLGEKLVLSCSRPFSFLLTEPVVSSFSLWVAFSWAVLYLNFGSIPLVFSTTYGFTLEQTGAVFTVILVSATLATLLSIFQDKAARKYNLFNTSPESRLYFACIESVCLPIGLFWFGWTAQPTIHWIVPTLGIGCAIAGIFAIYLATFNYLADAYGEFASSAIAAQSFCRNILGGVFPLVTNAMFEDLGYGVAGSILGGVGFALTLVPWVLVAFGPRIRAKSRFASASASASVNGGGGGGGGEGRCVDAA